MLENGAIALPTRQLKARSCKKRVTSPQKPEAAVGARRGAGPRVEPAMERPPWSSRRRGPARAARQVPPTGPRGGGAEPREAARPEPPATPGRHRRLPRPAPAARRRPSPSPGRPALLTCLSRCRRWRPSIPPFSSGRLRHGSRRCRLHRRPLRRRHRTRRRSPRPS